VNQSPFDVAAELASIRSEMQTKFDEILAMQVKFNEFLARLDGPRQARESYKVPEVAKMLGKGEYTVREWCRLGQINATKRSEGRGAARLWNISADEVARYKDKGLLPTDPNRNRGR
jgi:hypothetical protein